MFTGPNSYRSIFGLAWPIMLANCTVPILGLTDTAIIGNTAGATELGAIAFGSLIFNFVYWGCGFLKMGTSGMTAQALGAGNEPELRAILFRAVLLGGVLGLLLLIAGAGIEWAALVLLSGDAEVEALTGEYLRFRLWGAPASLAGFAVMGSLIGLSRSDLMLRYQLVLNGLNVVLDVLFAGVLGLGVAGIAMGTAIAEWVGLVYVLRLVLPLLESRYKGKEPFFHRSRVFDRTELLSGFRIHRDIVLRTLFLLTGFAIFTNKGAEFGVTVLAANHVLLQMITFSAYVLDGYANAVEPLVGRSLGSRNLRTFDLAVRRSMLLALASSTLLAVAALFLGPALIRAVAEDEQIRSIANVHLWICATYIFLSFAAFQLDGIFIGATQSRDMRNASIASLAVFLLLIQLPVIGQSNAGLWIAFVCYVVARALSLLACLPGLRRRCKGLPRAEAAS